MQPTEIGMLLISSVTLLICAFVAYDLYSDAKEEKKATKNKAMYTKKLRSVGNVR